MRIESFLINTVSFTFGKKRFQKFFRKLLSISLRGLNYGNLGFGEGHALDYILSKSNDGSQRIIFDVGANIGEYSEMILKREDSNVLIYAFEPAKITFQTLVKNQNLIKVIKENIGLGSSEGEMKLYRQSESSPLASVFQRDFKGQRFEVFDIVKIETIDIFCLERDIEKIHFAKIDVEGFEMEVLKGAEKMIKANKIIYIQFEFGGTQINSRTFFKDFWEFLSPYYKISRILKDGFEEIIEYNERLEIFGYSNYLCELK